MFYKKQNADFELQFAYYTESGNLIVLADLDLLTIEIKDSSGIVQKVFSKMDASENLDGIYINIDNDLDKDQYNVVVSLQIVDSNYADGFFNDVFISHKFVVR